MKVSDITAFTELAYQFGPFFFALLFTLVISRWSYSIYHKQGKASSSEKNTYRLVFVSSTFFGMLLVVVSVIWWWNYRPTTYVFRGQVRNLQEYEKLVSSSLYFKSTWTGKVAEGVPQFHDEEFAVIQESPFAVNQEFDMYFSKRDGSPQKMSVDYEVLDKNPQFEIVWDDSAQANKLKRISKSTSPNADLLSRILGAPAFASVWGHPVPETGAPYRYQAQSPVNRNDELIKILQDERSGVGNKIAALDRILAVDKASLRKIISTKTAKEEMILTITDLTRHSDRELASKARLVSERADIDGMILTRLKSSATSTVRGAQQLVRRLDREEASRVVRGLDASRASSMKGFVNEILAGRGLTPLKPTGSSQGDRYYVRATWDKNSGEVVECLIRLFNRELSDKESQAEESVFMKGRSERWVYWYSKEWALHIASEINSCGGNAIFDRPLMKY